jgi:hypothetical protein
MSNRGQQYYTDKYGHYDGVKQFEAKKETETRQYATERRRDEDERYDEADRRGMKKEEDDRRG